MNKAWVLSEIRHGVERIRGVALSYAAKDEWMRGDYPVGTSRTAAPVPIILGRTATDQAQRAES